MLPLPHKYPWRTKTHWENGRYFNAHKFVMDPCRGSTQHDQCPGHHVVNARGNLPVAYCTCPCHH